MAPSLPLYPEQRRLATILFADIESFTALAERLDAEDVSDMVKEIWERVDLIIEQHHGFIDKHIGDAVLAVWGAPQACEDGAERAVTVALELQQVIAAYTVRTNGAEVEHLRLRVGINTGPVLAGYVGPRDEYTIVGDTVNVAHRLQSSAEPATVVISESTYQLVRGAFKIHSTQPLKIEGKTGLFLVFQVSGKYTHSHRVRYRNGGGLEMRLVARDTELMQLHTFYRQAPQTNMPTLIIVQGEPGIGKSRLLLEFTNQLETQNPSLSLLSTRALEQTSRAPFFVWKSLWQTYFGFSESDPPEQAREKFLQGLRQLWSPSPTLTSAVEAAHLMGHLIGLTWPDSPFLNSFGEDSVGLTQRAFELTRELLHHLSLSQTVVLVIDDLQWADSSSLDLLTYLLDPVAAPFPLLVVAASRPQTWLNDQQFPHNAIELILPPLPMRAQTVSAAFPALQEMKPEVWQALAARAEGNPYFLEEMVKNLVRNISAEEIKNLTPAVLAQQLPASIRESLQARLDTLSPEAHAIALLASVVGRAFWVGAVLAEAQYASNAGVFDLVSQGKDDALSGGLAELVKAELAFPRVGSLLPGEQEYIFKHSLLREVAYGLLPHKHRRQYHLAVARWLTHQASSDFMAAIADHLEQAGEYQEAARQFEQAAHYAQARGAREEAHGLYAHANELRIKEPPKLPTTDVLLETRLREHKSG